MEFLFKKIKLIVLTTLILNQTHPLDITQTPSLNFDDRIDKRTKETVKKPTFIIIHYTSGCTEKKGYQSLSNYFRRVSAHYLICANGNISQLVDESKRAWHAGKSSWKDNDQLNSYSIGIEIVNPGFSELHQDPCTQNENVWNKNSSKFVAGSPYFWYPFTPEQIKSTIALCKEIINRYDIKPENILGHSDVAPGRKVDPGPLFPWKELAEDGIGIWYNDQTLSENISAPILEISKIQDLLNAWGYKTPRSGTLDDQTKKVIQAFQMHFRSENIDGIPDNETIIILKHLLKKTAGEAQLFKKSTTKEHNC